MASRDRRRFHLNGVAQLGERGGQAIILQVHVADNAIINEESANPDQASTVLIQHRREAQN